MIYFSRTNHYLFKEPQALKLHWAIVANSYQLLWWDLLFPVSNQNSVFQSYNKFDETKSLSDLKNANFSFTSADPNENFLFPPNSFSKIVAFK